MVLVLNKFVSIVVGFQPVNQLFAKIKQVSSLGENLGIDADNTTLHAGALTEFNIINTYTI